MSASIGDLPPPSSGSSLPNEPKRIGVKRVAAPFTASHIKRSCDPRAELFKECSIPKELVMEKIATLLSSNDPISKLAANILDLAIKKDKSGEEMKTILNLVDNSGFLKNPVHHMVNWMIGRGVGMFSVEDRPADFVISHIPNFADEMGNLDALRKFAATYFENHPNKDAILKIFNESLATPAFQEDFYHGLYELKELHSSVSLRGAFDVYNLAERFEIYSYSAELPE
jgi:hypothetical protein